MKLFLTSNFPMANNEAIAKAIHNISNNPKILYVGYSDSAKKYTKKLEPYSFKNIDFINIAKTSMPTDLFSYNVILMHGGNPSTIKSYIDKRLFNNILISENKLVITTSGSTCVFSKKFSLINTFYPSWINKDTLGLNFFPNEILPHYQRYRKKQNEIEGYAEKEKVFALPDGTALVYDGKKIEPIGDVKIFESLYL